MTIRKPIDEFFAAIRLEDSLGFIFVEGPGDRILIDQFINYLSARSWSVYDCTQIEFEDDNQKGGNRARLLRLGNEIVRMGLGNAICIIDRDLDIFFNSPNETTATRYTDFANMLMYGLDIENLHTVIGRFINSEVNGALIETCVEFTKFVFFLREAKRSLGLQTTMPDPSNFIERKAGNYLFASDTFTDKLSGGDKNIISNDMRQIIAQQIAGVAEHRLYMNDHDFAVSLSKILRLCKKRNVINSEQVRTLLRVLASPEVCASHSLFKYLASRMT